MCICVLMDKSHAHCDCCGASHLCSCLCLLMHKTYAHSHSCEAKHACACLYVHCMLTGIAVKLYLHVSEYVFGLVHKAHGHSDCCVVMHACVRVCVCGACSL